MSRSRLQSHLGIASKLSTGNGSMHLSFHLPFLPLGPRGWQSQHLLILSFLPFFSFLCFCATVSIISTQTRLQQNQQTSSRQHVADSSDASCSFLCKVCTECRKGATVLHKHLLHCLINLSLFRNCRLCASRQYRHANGRCFSTRAPPETACWP